METYLIISNIILFLTCIALGIFAALKTGESFSDRRFIKTLYRDKKHLQKNLELINNKLAIRSGGGSLKNEPPPPEVPRVTPKIVSPSESIQRLKTPPGAKEKFWNEAEKIK